MMKRILSLCLLTAGYVLVSPHGVRAEIVPVDSPRILPLVNPPVGTKPNAVPEASGEERAGDQASILRFFNGDALHGELHSIDGQKTVRWAHAEARGVIDFSPATIARIELNPTLVPGRKQRGHCLVRLTNGDELLGDLTSLDREALLLETWYAGPMTIPRQRVQSVVPLLDRPGSVYEGPTGLKGWQTLVIDNDTGDKAGWRYANGAFLASRPCSAGRDVKLPALANIEFDLAWRGSLEFMITLYVDSFKEEPGDGYALQLSEGGVSLHSMRKDGNTTQLGNAELPDLAAKRKSRFSIRVNRELKTISLVEDDMLVKQWKERGEFVGKGTGLAFVQQAQGAVKLSNIRVSEWDGRFDEQPAPPSRSKDDLVKLSNSDKVTGTLQSIKDGQMSFKTPFAALDVPLQRVSRIDLASESANRATNAPGAVRAEFADRGRVTIQLERWDSQQAVGTSPNFGRLKFDPSAFSQIQFNLQRPESDADTMEADDFEMGN